jgi:hypothetical protein
MTLRLRISPFDKRHNTIAVWVGGVRIVRFTDRERSYRSGSIALYAEDSSVWYSPLELGSSPVVKARTNQALTSN